MNWLDPSQDELWFVCVYAPVVLGAGWLMLKGVRGRRVWGRVKCAKCGADLSTMAADETRQCGSCGAAVSEKKGVKIGRGVSKRLIVLAILLMVLPWGGLLGEAQIENVIAAQAAKGKTRMSNQRLVAGYVAGLRDRKLGGELYKRLEKGELDEKDLLRIVERFKKMQEGGKNCYVDFNVFRLMELGVKKGLLGGEDVVGAAKSTMVLKEEGMRIEGLGNGKYCAHCRLRKDYICRMFEYAMPAKWIVESVKVDCGVGEGGWGGSGVSGE